jgi:anaerobic magnesium-protoporphyrin IX monomethyl ester cyclase
MITLINPTGIKTFSGLQMRTPNPPLGLAYIATAIKDAALPYQVIDGTGEALDVVRPYPDRDDFMIQGLPFDGITARVHPDAGDTRYANRFVDRFYTRRRWRKLAETAHR